jgi:surface protein
VKNVLKIFTILLIMYFVLLYAPAVQAAEIVHSGKSGDIDWSIDSEGRLTLSGSGNDSSREWQKYASEIKTAKVDIEDITSLSYMFYGCGALTYADLTKLDTSKVTDMAAMFYECRSLASLDLSGFDTSRVTDMAAMFYECSGLREINLNGWDTSKVTDMQEMFSRCGNLLEIDLGGFHTENVTNMSGMFFMCHGLTSLDLSSFCTTNVLYMGGMFCRCENLKVLNMENCDMSKCKSAEDMFTLCHVIEEIRAPYRVKVDVEIPAGGGKEWRDEFGNVYTRFPKDMEKSVVLRYKRILKKGDINADGKITMADLMMCLHHVSGRMALAGDEFLAADIDGGGEVKMNDLMRILHYVSGRNTEI